MVVEVFKNRPKMELPDACCKVGCKNAAEFQPVLCMWAKGDWKRKPTTCLRMEISLTICGPCAKTAKAIDFISDEGWKQISDTIVGIGRAEPDRASAVLELRPIPGKN